MKTIQVQVVLSFEIPEECEQDDEIVETLALLVKKYAEENPFPFKQTERSESEEKTQRLADFLEHDWGQDKSEDDDKLFAFVELSPAFVRPEIFPEYLSYTLKMAEALAEKGVPEILSVKTGFAFISPCSLFPATGGRILREKKGAIKTSKGETLH